MREPPIIARIPAAGKILPILVSVTCVLEMLRIPVTILSPLDQVDVVYSAPASIKFRYPNYGPVDPPTLSNQNQNAQFCSGVKRVPHGTAWSYPYPPGIIDVILPSGRNITEWNHHDTQGSYIIETNIPPGVWDYVLYAYASSSRAISGDIFTLHSSGYLQLAVTRG